MHTHPTPADRLASAALPIQSEESPRTFRVLYVAPLAIRRTTNRRQVESSLSLEAAMAKAHELNATVPNRGHFGCPFYEVAPDIKRKPSSVRS